MRRLVERFYYELWNQVDLDCAHEILHRDVDFRGSVGLHAHGRDAVCEYVSMVTTSLADYRCEIKTLIVGKNVVDITPMPCSLAKESQCSRICPKSMCASFLYVVVAI